MVFLRLLQAITEKYAVMDEPLLLDYGRLYNCMLVVPVSQQPGYVPLPWRRSL
jgi:hypothetical protein